MPHLVIEYSGNLEGPLDVQEMVDRVHTAALAHPVIPLPGLRTRAIPFSSYRIADGDPTNGLIALTARLAPGRSAEDKASLLESLMAALETTVSPIGHTYAVALSVEIQEMNTQFRINHNHVRTRIETQATKGAPRG